MQLEDYFTFLSEDDIRLKGSRIGIETILYNFINRELSPEAIADTYRSLTLEQVYATILYYQHNKEAVSKYLTDWIEYGREMRRQQEANPSPAILELRRLKAERLATKELDWTVFYLLDENLTPLYKTQLHAKKLHFPVFRVGDPGYPPRGTLDPEILCRCEEIDLIFITNNRTSLHAHLKEHLAQGRHVPGIIALNEEMMDVEETVEELILITENGTPNKYRDCITYLPETRL